MRDGWIGVDFDGTLAYYIEWLGPLTFGGPIPVMVERVKNWLEEGYEVRIVTARAFDEGGAIRPEVVEALDRWMIANIGCMLPITCEKDLHMIELWDDRAVQVVQNTGNPVVGSTSRLEEPNGELFGDAESQLVH